MTRPSALTAEYLQAVEQALLAGLGRGLMLSAADLDLVHRWARAGVPAEVVVAGIEKAFAPRPRTTRGLAYAVPSVEAAIKAWLERRVGGEPEGPAAEVAVDRAVVAALEALLARVADAGLRQVPPTRLVLRDAWKQLNSLKDRCSAGEEPDPVAAVEAIDRRLFEALWAEAAEADRALIDAGVEASLRGEASTGAAAAEVRYLRRWKALRARLGLPALVLEVGGGW